jgi:hypothetical protein
MKIAPRSTLAGSNFLLVCGRDSDRECLAGAIMSPIRITREVRQGWLSGNGIACKCRVELATKISPGFPTVRTLDIWLPEKPPDGHYKVQLDDATLDVQFKRGAWLEAVA